MALSHTLSRSVSDQIKTMQASVHGLNRFMTCASLTTLLRRLPAEVRVLRQQGVIDQRSSSNYCYKNAGTCPTHPDKTLGKKLLQLPLDHTARSLNDWSRLAAVNQRRPKHAYVELNGNRDRHVHYVHVRKREGTKATTGKTDRSNNATIESPRHEQHVSKGSRFVSAKQELHQTGYNKFFPSYQRVSKRTLKQSITPNAEKLHFAQQGITHAVAGSRSLVSGGATRPGSGTEEGGQRKTMKHLSPCPADGARLKTRHVRALNLQCGLHVLSTIGFQSFPYGIDDNHAHTVAHTEQSKPGCETTLHKCLASTAARPEDERVLIVPVLLLVANGDSVVLDTLQLRLCLSAHRLFFRLTMPFTTSTKRKLHDLLTWHPQNTGAALLDLFTIPLLTNTATYLAIASESLAA